MVQGFDSKKKIKVEGVINDTLPGTMFRVALDLQGQAHEILAHLSGKMRMNYIKLQKGDKVDVEISPYDLSRGIIVYRR